MSQVSHAAGSGFWLEHLKLPPAACGKSGSQLLSRAEQSRAEPIEANWNLPSTFKEGMVKEPQGGAAEDQRSGLIMSGLNWAA